MKHPIALRIILAALLASVLTIGAHAAPTNQGRNDRNDRPQPRRAEPAHPQAKPQPRPQPQPRRAEPERRPAPQVNHFEDRHRSLVHNYFQREYRGKRCPPGLVRRGQHCVSGPRLWSRGRVLPRTVIYYDVPAPLLYELPPPPHGQRYVRVAGDILLIAVGTGLVIDAIQDIFD